MIDAIDRDIHLRDVAKRGEQIPQLPFRRNCGQIIYIYFVVRNVHFKIGFYARSLGSNFQLFPQIL